MVVVCVCVCVDVGKKGIKPRECVLVSSVASLRLVPNGRLFRLLRRTNFFKPTRICACCSLTATRLNRRPIDFDYNFRSD